MAITRVQLCQVKKCGLLAKRYGGGKALCHKCADRRKFHGGYGPRQHDLIAYVAFDPYTGVVAPMNEAIA